MNVFKVRCEVGEIYITSDSQLIKQVAYLGKKFERHLKPISCDLYAVFACVKLKQTIDHKIQFTLERNFKPEIFLEQIPSIRNECVFERFFFAFISSRLFLNENVNKVLKTSVFSLNFFNQL